MPSWRKINTDTYMQSVCLGRRLYVNFHISRIVIVFKSECLGYLDLNIYRLAYSFLF